MKTTELRSYGDTGTFFFTGGGDGCYPNSIASSSMQQRSLAAYHATTSSQHDGSPHESGCLSRYVIRAGSVKVLGCFCCSGSDVGGAVTSVGVLCCRVVVSCVRVLAASDERVERVSWRESTYVFLLSGPANWLRRQSHDDVTAPQARKQLFAEGDNYI